MFLSHVRSFARPLTRSLTEASMLAGEEVLGSINNEITLIIMSSAVSTGRHLTTHIQEQ